MTMTQAKKAPSTRFTPESDNILGRAMLANVRIRMWEGRKFDREVTDKVNDEYAASNDAGRYHKKLFGGKVPELSAIITAAAGLRGTHYNQTLPWSDEGWRLLPTENYFQYTKAMREAIAKFDTAVGAFVTAYPRLKSAAKDKLNGMYRESDYPQPGLIFHRFSATLDFGPVPAGDDFRVSLPAKELARISKEVEERVAKSVEDAMNEAWERLGETVVKLREKLDDGKYLRDSMIERVREVAEVLGRLNITKDAALEKARTRVITELTGFSADTLKDDEKVRAKAAKSADDILKSMRGVFTPPKKEDK